MINTKLHNYLIEKDMEQKTIQSKIHIESLKSDLLMHRLKNYALIALFIFFILLLIKILFYSLPNSTDILRNPEVYNKQTNENFPHEKKAFNEEENPPIQTSAHNKKVLKNGIDYIKEDNLIYKRVWENAKLVKKIKLAPTIKESKNIEKIPQFSHEKVK